MTRSASTPPDGTWPIPALTSAALVSTDYEFAAERIEILCECSEPLSQHDPGRSPQRLCAAETGEPGFAVAVGHEVGSRLFESPCTPIPTSSSQPWRPNPVGYSRPCVELDWAGSSSERTVLDGLDGDRNHTPSIADLTGIERVFY